MDESISNEYVCGETVCSANTTGRVYVEKGAKVISKTSGNVYVVKGTSVSRNNTPILFFENHMGDGFPAYEYHHVVPAKEQCEIRTVVEADLIIPWHLIDKEWEFAAVCKSYNPKVWFFKYYPSWNDLDEPHLLGGDAVQSVMRISTNNVAVGAPSLVKRPKGV